MKVTASRKKSNSSKTTVAKRKKRNERKVKIPLKDKDIKKLENACETERETRIITIFLETGMHPEVMAEPEKHDMDTVRGTLTWKRPKTEAMCIWEYPEDMEELVQEFIKNDLGYNRATYWRWVKGIAERAGLEHVSPLTLRHTATIEGLKKKSPEQVLQTIRCSPKVLWGHYADIRGLR